MVVTKQDRLSSEQAIKCWISQEDFEEDDKRVRDHFHYPGRFRGATHKNATHSTGNQNSPQ